MAKFIARVFVPMYIELEADGEQDAKEAAQQWYREQKKEWRTPEVELVPNTL